MSHGQIFVLVLLAALSLCLGGYGLVALPAALFRRQWLVSGLLVVLLAVAFGLGFSAWAMW
jgi:hypothetical protein